MITFCTLIGDCRTWTTVPWKVWSGKASTVKPAPVPRRTPAMSDSLTLVSTCILVRSVAIRNRVGVCRLAATVWPAVTLRVTTVPSTGETMLV